MQNDLAASLQQIINKKRMEEIAKDSLFVQRSSEKINSNIFFELNVFDNRNICTESLEELSVYLYKSKNIKISSQALDERFNSKGVNFLKEVFNELMVESTRNKFQITTAFTEHFNRIRITDSSTTDLPNNCKSVYKGHGGCAKESATRLQLTYDLKAGNIVLADVADVTLSDAGFLSTLDKTIEEKDLEIKDLGYFSIENFSKIDKASAYYLSRLKTNTVVYVKNPNPEKFSTGNIIKSTEYIKLDLVKESKSLTANEIKEFEVFIGEKKVKSRLVLCRLPEEAVAKKLENHKKIAHKKQIETSEKSKELSIVNIYITNVSSEIIPKEIVYLIYSLRWQIEIIFKILKSTLKLDKVKKVKIERIQCHIYGTLIKMLLSSQIVFSLREQIYTNKSKELSEYKAFKIVVSFLNEMKNALFYSISNLQTIFKKIEISILDNGIKSKNKNKKTVFQILNL